MPCYDPRPAEEARDTVRMLCAVLSMLEKSLPPDAFASVLDMEPGMRAWWDEHRKRDEREGRR